VAVRAEHFKVLRSVIGGIPIDVVNFQWNLSSDRVSFAPSTLGAFVVALVEQPFFDST
jgi:hypothetical protein